MDYETESKTNKFAFVGPASVGKSTMTDIYKRRYGQNPHVAVLEEGAHLFFLRNPQVSQGPIHIFDVQEQIQKFVLEQEKAAHQPQIRLIISDRSVIDPIVYAQSYLDKQNVEKLLQNVRWWLPTYTTFFLLNPDGVPLEPGRFRQETPEARLRVYEAFGEFLIKNSLPHEVISGSVPERTAKIDMTIYQFDKDHTIFEYSPSTTTDINTSENPMSNAHI